MAPAMMEKVLGLSGEAGEVADKFKKIIRDKGGDLSVEDKEAVVKELGDVLWYIAGISRYLDTPLSEVARKNLEKLYSRLDRNKIAGDGDNR
ncbi:nucleoside triphosphate pyrophosphohydrolase family protein [Candidatus Saccharibacteria bacterium]|nr:nucleoside triphosphate pyrophosphohydrolase family protein [Candidatus Saccharibacteria bacterium]